MAVDHSIDHLDLAALVEDPAKVASVPPTRIAALLSQLSAVQSAIAARLIAADHDEPASTEDTLLTADQAAERLGVSKDWLFRRSRTLPFVVRLGRHLRFSNRGIDRYLRSRTGREGRIRKEEQWATRHEHQASGRMCPAWDGSSGAARFSGSRIT